MLRLGNFFVRFCRVTFMEPQSFQSVASIICHKAFLFKKKEYSGQQKGRKRKTFPALLLFQLHGGHESRRENGYSVAAMTALMVCIRFSASSKTMDCAPSKTSSVTSMQSMPNLS